MPLPLIPLAVAGAGVIARFVAKKGIKEAVKKYGKKAVTEVQKNAKDMVTKKTPGQAKVVTPVKAQRQYRKGTRVAAGMGVAAGAVGGVAAMRKALKTETDARKRAQLQTAIEKAVAKVNSEKATSTAPKTSTKPKARAKPMRPKARP